MPLREGAFKADITNHKWTNLPGWPGYPGVNTKIHHSTADSQK